MASGHGSPRSPTVTTSHVVKDITFGTPEPLPPFFNNQTNGLPHAKAKSNGQHSAASPQTGSPHSTMGQITADVASSMRADLNSFITKFSQQNEDLQRSLQSSALQSESRRQSPSLSRSDSPLARGLHQMDEPALEALKEELARLRAAATTASPRAHSVPWAHDELLLSLSAAEELNQRRGREVQELRVRLDEMKSSLVKAHNLENDMEATIADIRKELVSARTERDEAVRKSRKERSEARALLVEAKQRWQDAKRAQDAADEMQRSLNQRELSPGSVASQSVRKERDSALVALQRENSALQSELDDLSGMLHMARSGGGGAAVRGNDTVGRDMSSSRGSSSPFSPGRSSNERFEDPHTLELQAAALEKQWSGASEQARRDKTRIRVLEQELAMVTAHANEQRQRSEATDKTIAELRYAQRRIKELEAAVEVATRDRPNVSAKDIEIATLLEQVKVTQSELDASRREGMEVKVSCDHRVKTLTERLEKSRATVKQLSDSQQSKDGAQEKELQSLQRRMSSLDAQHKRALQTIENDRDDALSRCVTLENKVKSLEASLDALQKAAVDTRVSTLSEQQELESRLEDAENRLAQSMARANELETDCLRETERVVDAEERYSSADQRAKVAEARVKTVEGDAERLEEALAKERRRRLSETRELRSALNNAETKLLNVHRVNTDVALLNVSGVAVDAVIDPTLSLSSFETANHSISKQQKFVQQHQQQQQQQRPRSVHYQAGIDAAAEVGLQLGSGGGVGGGNSDDSLRNRAASMATGMGAANLGIGRRAITPEPMRNAHLLSTTSSPQARSRSRASSPARSVEGGYRRSRSGDGDWVSAADSHQQSVETLRELLMIATKGSGDGSKEVANHRRTHQCGDVLASVSHRPSIRHNNDNMRNNTASNSNRAPDMAISRSKTNSRVQREVSPGRGVSQSMVGRDIAGESRSVMSPSSISLSQSILQRHGSPARTASPKGYMWL